MELDWSRVVVHLLGLPPPLSEIGCLTSHATIFQLYM